MENPVDDLMTPADVAEELGVSIAWLAQRRYMGDGPPFTRLSPRKVRYRRAEVDAWLIDRTETKTSA